MAIGPAPMHCSMRTMSRRIEPVTVGHGSLCAPVVTHHVNLVARITCTDTYNKGGRFQNKEDVNQERTCPHECRDAFVIQATALDDDVLEAAADAIGAKHTDYSGEAALDERANRCLRSSRCRTQIATAAGNVHLTINEACKNKEGPMCTFGGCVRA
jgi:hypothetical protein